MPIEQRGVDLGPRRYPRDVPSAERRASIYCPHRTRATVIAVVAGGVIVTSSGGEFSYPNALQGLVVPCPRCDRMWAMDVPRLRAAVERPSRWRVRKINVMEVATDIRVGKPAKLR